MPGTHTVNDNRSRLRGALWLAAIVSALAADLPGSKDPPGMKRYEGSEIIGYRATRFDEFLLPLGPQTQKNPTAYEKKLKAGGLFSHYTYVTPPGPSPADLLLTYKR